VQRFEVRKKAVGVVGGSAGAAQEMSGVQQVKAPGEGAGSVVRVRAVRSAQDRRASEGVRAPMPTNSFR